MLGYNEFRIDSFNITYLVNVKKIYEMKFVVQKQWINFKTYV